MNRPHRHEWTAGSEVWAYAEQLEAENKRLREYQEASDAYIKSIWQGNDYWKLGKERTRYDNAVDALKEGK